jgi:plastocyanin
MRKVLPRRRQAVLALAALPLVLVLAACGGDDDDDAASSEPGVVVVEDNTFEPESIEVGVGDTVTWQFEGNSAHNVSGEGFVSDLMKDGSFEHTFDAEGEFDYVCTVHPGMAGTVEVTGTAAP